jgi:hypothetical protein
VNDLQEELASPRVEDEDGAVDGLRRQVSFERLVDRYSIHVRVVHEPVKNTSQYTVISFVSSDHATGEDEGKNDAFLAQNSEYRDWERHLDKKVLYTYSTIQNFYT